MSKSTGNFLTLVQAIEQFSADGMRLCLADCGDGVEDANFVTKNADSALLRLYTYLEFCEMVASKSSDLALRENPERNENDKMFEAVLHHAMRTTEANFEAVNFKEAVKSGVFELMAAKDTYVAICGERGMNYDLLMKYIRFQTIVLTPITPHLCEHIWQKVLGRDSSICTTLWPVVHPQNDAERSLIDGWNFFQHAARDMRLKYKSQLQAIEKKRAKGKVEAEPCHVNLYVAETLPMWQSTAIEVIKTNLGPNGEWPEMKVISSALSPKQRPELKKFAKKMMPFVAMLKDGYTRDGIAALTFTCSFDQTKILELNHDYMIPKELESMKILPVSQASESIQNEASPGKPTPDFVALPGAEVYCKVVQVGAGVPSQNITIRTGDSIETVFRRLKRANRQMKGKGKAADMSLYRYADPVLGPRKLPSPYRGDAKEWAKENELVQVGGDFSIEKDSVVNAGKALGSQVLCLV